MYKKSKKNKDKSKSGGDKEGEMSSSKERIAESGAVSQKTKKKTPFWFRLFGRPQQKPASASPCEEGQQHVEGIEKKVEIEGEEKQVEIEEKEEGVEGAEQSEEVENQEKKAEGEGEEKRVEVEEKEQNEEGEEKEKEAEAEGEEKEVEIEEKEEDVEGAEQNEEVENQEKKAEVEGEEKEVEIEEKEKEVEIEEKEEDVEGAEQNEEVENQEKKAEVEEKEPEEDLQKKEEKKKPKKPKTKFCRILCRLFPCFKKPKDEPTIELTIEPPVQVQEKAPVQDQEEAPVQHQEEAPMQVQVEAPVQIQEEAPVQDPIEPPVQIQEEAPVQDPVEPPVQIQEEASVQDSVEPPVQIKEEAPVEPPVQAQEEASVQDSVEPPVQIKEEAPVEPPVQDQVEAPVQAPVQAQEEASVQDSVEPPVQIKEEAPVEPPVQAQEEASVQDSVEPPVQIKEEAPVEPPVQDQVEAPVQAPVEAPVEPIIRPNTVQEQVQTCRLGFPNPGQLCYMNSSLQSLLTLTHFIQDINSQEVSEGLNPGAELLSCFMNIRRCRSSKDLKSKLRATLALKRLISRKAPEFIDDDQKDAHEFVTTVIDQIRNLSQPLKKYADFNGSKYKCPVETNIEFLMENTRTCKSCSSGSMREESFTSLSLDVVKNLSVQDMLHNYQKEEDLEYSCDCGGNTSSQKCAFQTLPNILILHLKRFRYTPTFRLVKVHDPVRLCRNLTLSTNQTETSYSLVSVISHIGKGTNSGHYICDGVYSADQWLNYNDSRVQKTSSATVCDARRKTAYILFYQKL